MLGSMKKCSNCHGTDFRRIKINRTVQCENCKLILEERCMSDLMEFHAVTQTEEVYCAVTPDFLHNHLVDDIPNDPYCTPGFISAFRMLSPLREPVYAASSRTLNGALAEMERLIGDALFAGYVGYNGRAPGGSAVKKEEAVDASDRNKSGGDARHTLVAYFEIVELASILCVDKETTNLAIRIFRHTASNTSLRNRNVESLATAAFVSAAERRWHEYQQWLREHKDDSTPEAFPIDPNPDQTASMSQANSPWPVAPRRLSVEEISAAANLDTSEVLRYLKVVNIALRKQRSESNSSITEHMPSFCRRLELPEQTQKLAIAIAENAMKKQICSRRNPGSVAAAAIYLACQLHGVRKTQTEICRATPLTEVTLRKVRNELNAERDALLPEWYKTEEKEGGRPPPVVARPAQMPEENSSEPSNEDIENNNDAPQTQPEIDSTTPDPSQEMAPEVLVPPPLPPGFGGKEQKGKTETRKPMSDAANTTQATEQSQKATNPVNPLLAMVNNPAMQAFANAMSMMPQFMMPPPPPPLPPAIETATAKEKETTGAKDNANEKSEDKSTEKPPTDSVNTTETKEQEPPAASTPPSADMMASMQSMMGMMQAMQAFQAMQQQSTPNGDGSVQNPWAIMANALVQSQQGTVTPGQPPNPGFFGNPQPSSNPSVLPTPQVVGTSSTAGDNVKSDKTGSRVDTVGSSTDAGGQHSRSNPTLNHLQRVPEAAAVVCRRSLCMDSTEHISTEETPSGHRGISSDVKPEVVCEWDDVTDAFKTASGSMEVGEMIRSESFSLFAAMSAIELMDPRMDIGCGTIKNVKEVPLPDMLSDQQVINIMDQLLACEMSWLNAHTLPQTVFSCVYAQRLTEIPRPELFSYLRLQIATMDMIVNLILDERVAEEEDFISWTFGFRLRPLRHGGDGEDSQILKDMLDEVEEFSGNLGYQGTILKESIYTRVKFCVQFYRTLNYLVKNSVSESTDQALELLTELRDTANAWESCALKQTVDYDLIDRVFDDSINRHLVTSTPPRTAPLLSVKAAFKYLHELITELLALVNLRHMALPRSQGDNSANSEGRERYSLHVAIHAVESFCAEHKPKILTRSLLSRLMVPKQALALFGTNDAHYLKLVATDMGFRENFSPTDLVEPYRRLTDGIVGIFKCMCRNRSRQRRQILHVLRWWDHYSCVVSLLSNRDKEANGFAAVSSEGKGLQGSAAEPQMLEESNNGSSKEKVDYFENKNPFQIVSYEISARLLIQHLLLGFEVDLYQEYEYAAVFFYIGYTLTAMAHATASFTRTGRKQAAFHPLRLSLYIMDEARLWLCRALYSTLEALSTGDLWDYSCDRARQRAKSGPGMFGGDDLWYEQRFGVVNGLRNVPAYADYSSFLAFKTMQSESLHSGEDETDSILLRLREAASGFLAARRNAEKAKRAAARCKQNFVTEEVLRIARVAIENSLVVSALLRLYEDQRGQEPQKKYKVLFKFSRHQHFPVLEVVAKE